MNTRYSIGGSIAASIAEVHPYMTRLEAYYAITEGREVKQNEPMYWGSKIEPLIRERYESETGHFVSFNDDPDKLGIEVIHQRHDFITGSLDGITHNVSTGDKWIFEAKTARTRDAWFDGVPDWYQLQVQHYMGITGFHRADVAVLFGASDFEIFKIERDDDIVDNLFSLEVAFWRDHVLQRIPPEPSTLSDVNLRWRTSTSHSIEASDTISSMYSDLKAARSVLKDTENQIAAIETQIKKYMEDSDTLTIDGYPAVTWKQSKPMHVFDKDRLKIDDPEVFNRYFVEKPGARRFLVK